MPVTNAEALIRRLLDRFYEVVGEARITVPESRGMNFYEVLTLASIVEHEAIVDDERALIAALFPAHVARVARLFGVLSATEQDELRRLCRKLGTAAGCGA